MIEELREEWAKNPDATWLWGFSSAMPITKALSNDLPGFRSCWDDSGLTAGSDDVDLATLESFATAAGFHTAQIDKFDWLEKATVAADFRKAKSEGRHALFLNTQLGGGPPPTLRIVQAAYQLGLRMLQLTYNTMTTIGSGCTERTDAGVSSFGASLIEMMNDLGIIVDTSHCGKQTTLDACSLSKRPVVASHTSAEGLFLHDRAKSNQELEAIAKTGGVIGVCAVPFFLAKDEPTIDVMLDHIDYIVKLVGVDHVSIGTDWPLPRPKWILEEVGKIYAYAHGFSSEHNLKPEQNLVGFDDYRDFPNITRGLVSRGYDDSEIKGILGENFLRVFEAVCG